jgi:purine-nucleoside phosphorylase
VLGSGLSGAILAFEERASIPFCDIPGLNATTVHGHVGRLALGIWNNVPLLLFAGRSHFYEGQEPASLTRPVQIAAHFGIKLFAMTNAAGGINPALIPGQLMLIRDHMKLIGPHAWRVMAQVPTEPEPPLSPQTRLSNSSRQSVYSRRLIDSLCAREAAAGRSLFIGSYAALTGPSYETPAEIRALAACGADAVGMSTALEAEAAALHGLEVVAISCITNAAAGLGPGQLNHAEVLDNAKLAVERLGLLLGHLVRTG